MSDIVSARAAVVGLLALLAATAVSGCGKVSRPDTFPAGGVVKFTDGTPLANARIQFRAVGVEPAILARGTTDDQGKFQLTTFSPEDGAVEGTHKAIVHAFVPDDFDGMSPAETRRAMFPIDPKFKNFATSGLEFTVSSDPAQNQFEIKVWPPRGGR